MLQHLLIKNYALIEELSFSPASGLSVITGETGAGKSIMLGALGLVMGNRADTKVLWNEADKCIVEASFNVKAYKLKKIFQEFDLDYDDTTVLRREINTSGKSRAFINDTPVTLETLKEISSLLLDVHSQHETLQIGEQSFQLKLIDACAENELLLEKYTDVFKNYSQAKKNLEELKRKAEQLKTEADYIFFQVDELEKFNPQSGELIVLENELSVLEHTEEIKLKLNTVKQILQDGEFSALQNLREVKNQLQSIATLAKPYETLFERLQSVFLETEDIANEAENILENIEFDPARYEYVKERFNTLNRLLVKHKVKTSEQLLEIFEKLKEQAAISSDIDGTIVTREKEVEKLYNLVNEQAKILSEKRQKVFLTITKSITGTLKQIGIENAQIIIEHKTIRPTIHGVDEISILFSANKGMPPKIIAQVASGGEFARLMFAIKKLLASKLAMPTLVLDEIDTGVSGEVALQVGEQMREMAGKHQIITITHLPQIAAKGEKHFFVYKENVKGRTISNIKELQKAERITQLAEMIAGATPGKAAIESAKELLKV
jgi:DNA repair protein RecN (Recombination protein N)